MNLTTILRSAQAVINSRKISTTSVSNAASSKRSTMTSFMLALSLLFSLLRVESGWGQAVTDIYATGTAGSFKTGSVNSAGTKNDGNMVTVNSSVNRGWSSFDLSSIPTGSTISSVVLTYTTYSVVASMSLNNIYGFTGNPSTTTGSALYTNCGSGTAIATAATWPTNATGTRTLNATGITFIQNNCGSSFVNIGYVRGSSNTYNIYGYPGTTAQKPKLTITYVVPPPCSGVPNAGTSLISSASGCANANVNLSATGLSTGIGISYQWQYSIDNGVTWNNILGAINSTASVTPSVTTMYRIRTTCSNGPSSNNSSTITYTVNVSGACLCVAYPLTYATSTFDEEISNVTVGTLNNTSNCTTAATGAGSVLNRYANYSGVVTGPSAMQGSSVNFSLTQTSCGGAYSNIFQLYVDWNQDGDWLDAGERVYNQVTTVSGNQTVSGSFTVPAGATVGTTRMRVVNIEVSPTATNYAHTAYTYGETEDYCFTVNATPAITSFSPSSLCKGSTLTISGSNFSSSAVTGVTVNGVALSSYTVVNSTTITAVTTTTQASGVVAVTFAGGSSSSSSSLTMNSLPTITSSGSVNAVCTSSLAQTSTFNYSASTNSPTSYSIDWNAAAITAGLAHVATTSHSFLAGGGSFSVPIASTAPGVYNGVLSLTNANGCLGTLSINITITNIPTLTGVTQTSSLCYNPTISSTNASIQLSGLLLSIAQTATYNFDGGTSQMIAFTSSSSGTATLAIPVTMANNGQTLTISDINCANFTTNNSCVLTIIQVPTTPIVSPATLTVNVGASASITASLNPNNTGTTFRWWDASTAGNQLDPNVTTPGLDDAVFNSYQAQVNPPIPNNTPTPNVAFCTPSTNYTYYVEEFDAVSGCPSTRTPFVITTNPLFSNTPSNLLICQAGGSVTLQANITPLATQSFQWLSSTTGNPTTNAAGSSTSSIYLAAPSVTTNYALSTNLTPFRCSTPLTTSLMFAVGVLNPLNFTPTSTSSEICQGQTTTLQANTPSGTFSVESIIFAPASLPASQSLNNIPSPPIGTYTTLSTGGAATTTLSGGNLDDGGWGGIPIGFSYNYFGSLFSSLGVGTNGLVMFGAIPGYGTAPGELGQWQFQTAPNVFPNPGNPGNVIGLMLSDMRFNTPTTGNLRYWNDGIAPTRRFILSGTYPQWSGGALTTVQLILYETTGIVEVHITSSAATIGRTVGLQNADKTIGALAPGWGNRTTTLTTPQAWRFIPPAAYTFQWYLGLNTNNPINSATSSSYLTTSTQSASAGPLNYLVAVQNPNTQCISTKPVNITVNALPSAPISSGNVTACNNAASTTLTATAPTGCVVDWYSNANGTGLLLSGSSSYSFVPSANTYYAYSRNSTTGCSSATGTAIVLTVVTAPATLTPPTPAPYCQGDPASQLTTTGVTSSNPLNWYLGSLSATPSTIAPTPVTSSAGTTNYLVTQTSTTNGCASTPATISIVVNATPSAPAYSSTYTTGTITQCQGTAVISIANAVVASVGGTLYYYIVPTGGTALSSTPSSTPSFAGTTTYYVSQVISGCEGPRTVVTSVVNPSLTPIVAISASSTTVCPGGSITYNAVPTNGGPAPTYAWFVNATQVGTGSTYTQATPVSGDVIYATMVSNEPSCLFTQNATSSTITLNNSSVTPSVGIIQNTSTTICANSSVTFSVANALNMGATPTYDWKLNGTTVGTAATYSTTTLTNNDIVTLTMTSSLPSNCLTGGIAAANAAGITMTITPITAITAQPANASVCLGGAQSLAVSAIGTGTITYQWQSATTAGPFTNISFASNTSAQSATLSIPSVAGQLSYQLVATSSCGNATSSIATISINQATGITAQPQAVVACDGTIATFNVTAVGTGTISYQWRFNGTPITGATSASYSIPAVAAANAGQYSVVVSATCGSVTSANAQLIVNVLTTISSQPVNATICDSTLLNLSVTASGTAPISYQWYRGTTQITSTSATPGIYLDNVGTVAESGQYTVQVTGGCSIITSTASTVVVLPNTWITTQPVSYPGCALNPTSLSVTGLGANVQYQWYIGSNPSTPITGATSATYNLSNPQTSNSGTYTVTLTGANNGQCGTQTSIPTLLTINPVPSAGTISGGNSGVCVGSTINLTNLASGGVWTSSNQLMGSISSTGVLTGVSAGTITVTYTVTNSFGCVSTATKVIQVKGLPTAAIQTPLATSICQGEAMNLQSSAAVSYAWSTGATTQNIAVNSSATGTVNYSVTVTGTNACTATSAPVAITVIPVPTVAAITGTGNYPNFCLGNTSNLASATANGIWSSSNTNILTVNPVSGAANTLSIGTATVSYYVSNVPGCLNPNPGTATATITVSTPPAAFITSSGSTTFCQGGSITLTAPSGVGYNYLWSTGAITQTITVSTSGSYSLTVTATGGCSVTSLPTTVTVLPIPTATIFPTGAINICSGTNVTLSTGSAVSYVWSNGANTPTISVNAAGNYSVTLTGTNGCTVTSALSTVTVTPVPSAVITANGPTNICDGGSVGLSVPTAGSYLWSNGATTQAITATSTGNYSVTATNGICSTTSTPTYVNFNPVPSSSVTASGPTTFCQGGNVTLTAATGNSFTYLWSNGATTQSITVTASGTYSVTVSNSFNCSSTSTPISVVVNALPTASITAGGSTTICSGNSLSLTATSANAYLWSTGATTQSINVSVAGNYTVEAISAAGCTATSSVLALNVLPSPTAIITQASGTTFCQGGSVVINSTPASAYLWSNNETTQAISATTTGVYSVLVTAANGCTATSNAINVNVLPIPTAVIYPGTNVNICAGSTVTLSTGTAASYTWSNGANTPTITVGANGTHTVTLTGSNGCTATSAVSTITVNPIPVATITAAGSTNICSGTSVNLTASTAGSYLWSNGATTQTIAASLAGAYTVTVTTAGCSATSASTSVNVNPAPTALVTAGGPTSFCQGGSVSFTANAGNGYTYLWSNGETTSSITSSITGNFTVTVSNQIGCSTTSAVNAVVVNPIPVATITAGGSTTICSGSPVSLSAPAGSNYLWNTGSTSQSINAATAGNYTVVVTSAAGCSATSAPTTIVVNALPSAAISSSGSTTFCQGATISLSTTGGLSSYLWSTGETTSSLNVTTSGNYTVTVTNSNGCSATSSPTVVNVLTAPTALIYPGTNVNICAGSTVTLSTGTAASYAWSNGANTPTITVGANGTHTVTLTGSNGCTATSAVSTITVNPIPVATITAAGSTNICSGTSVNLTASTAGSYLWSNGATTQTIAASLAGAYTVTVTTAGCSATSASTSVNVNPAPTALVTASGPTSFCQGGSVSFTANAGNGYTYLWSNGETTATISTSTSGNNSVTVTNLIGCSTTSAVNAVVVNPIPVATITAGGSTTICSGTSVSLAASAGASYLWSNGATAQTINASLAGNYAVTVTSAAGCSANSIPTLISVNALPSASISSSGSTTICQGSSVSLSATNGMSSYLWNTGATSATVAASTSGNYTVTVTNSNGCSATSSPTVVNVLAAPTAVIYPGTNVSICAGSTVTLSTGTASSFAWSNGANTPTITVGANGTHTVTLTGSNGCTATSAVTTIAVNPIPVATITAAGSTNICSGTSVNLTASTADSYLWSNGATTQTIAASLAGTYTVTVTTAGCSATSSGTSINVNPAPSAMVTASGPTSLCQGGSVSFTANAGNGYTYLWSNGATTASITTSTAGNNTVTVTNQIGCSTTSAINAVVVNPIPVATITAGGSTTICSGSSVSLSASAGASYLWSNGATTQSINASLPVNYTVTVTSAAGCSASSSPTLISLNALPVAAISSSGSTAICQGSSVSLSATNGMSTYLWNTGATTASLTATTPGNYSVTVTNSNGCSATSSPTTVTVNQGPVAQIYPGTNVTICSGTNVTLSTPSATSYSWSNGSNTPTIQVSTAGTYAVTLTGSNGCSSTSPVTTVVVTPTPTATITSSGPTTICQGSSVTLSAPGSASTYLWSNGATTQSITASLVGSYFVTVGSNGCSATSPSTYVSYNPVPSAAVTANGPTTFCIGNSVIFSAPAGNGNTYLWNTGATTQTINTAIAGNFSVTVTNGYGCSATSTNNPVLVNPLPVVTPITGSSSICAGTQGQVSNVMTGGVYASSNLGTASIGQLNGQITGLTAGTTTISYIYTNSNGCSNTVTYPVTIIAAPVATITAGGPTTFCQGGSVVLTASSGTAYAWSNGATTPSITVSASGSFSVSVTGANGCSATSQATTVNVLTPSPVSAINGANSVCVNSATSFTNATSGGTWSTSNPLIATVSTAGNVTGVSAGSATITYAINSTNGCQNAATKVVNVNEVPATALTTSGATTFCQGSNVSLTASSGSTYLWSTGATTASITASTSGTYNVTVTNANGCSSVSTNQLITVNANPTAAISTNGSTNLCTGGSIVLMATPNSSYVWNTGATTSSITATTAGSYSVTVTNANGCSATSTATSVVVNASPSATVTASGPTSICSGSNVVLSATSVVGNTYQWSNNGVLISGATSASYTATTSGTYAVTVTNASGCSATSTTTPVSVVLATAATITPSGSTSLCSGSSVLLAANAGSSYLWSTGATTQSITVNTAANYSVTVTNALGCSATSTVLPVVVNAAPTATITAGGPTTFCQGGNVVLTASSGASYVWSNGATTASITASTPGSYSVLITNASGCAATAAATAVTVNAAPNATISAGGSTTFCSGGSVTLTASAGASYLWSTGATTASISVNTAGASTVTVTNAAGCSTTSAATTIVVNATPTASITAGGSTTICSGSTVTLTASAGSSYLWSNGATTASIVANTTGNYTVTVFNANGCSAISTPTTVTVNNPSVANISSSGSTNFCQGGSVVLTATAASTYAWSTGATTQAITVSASGNYSVTLTNASGCTSSSPVTVVTANALPTATITAGGTTTFCQGGSVTLTASPATSYVWNNGATSASITVSTAGSYTVQVANNSGCTATSAATTVVVNALPTASITAGGSLSICAGSTVNLTASTGAAYLWSNGATTATIAASNAGNYSVQVTNAAGCISTSAVSSVVVNALPTPSISSVGSTTLCQGATVTLTTANGTGLTYQWKNNGTNIPGATAVSYVANAVGSYTVQVTNAAGCIGTSTATAVVVNALPVASISNSGANTICAGTSVNLTASGGTAYTWSNGATSATIAANTTGNYTVSVSNAAGCTSSTSTAITVVTPTVASIAASGPTSFCAGQNVVLTANPGASYVWSTGATTASITVAATNNVSVQVTYVSGCVSTSPVTAVTANSLPTATIAASGATSFCPGATVTLTASAGSSYVWTNGATTNSIVVSASGSYGVSVTNASGCVATAAPTAITVFAVPTASITTSGATTFCQGSSLNLTANTGASYVWSSGETTSSISTGVSGNYSVTVLDANGCSAVSSIVPVTVNANPVATIQANGPTTVCQGTTVVLSANGGTGFAWSNAEITSSISVTTTGSYGVTVTNAAGCSSVVTPVSITVNPVQVLSPIVGASNVCVGASTTYTNSTSGGTWSSDNTAVATVNSTSGNVSGISTGSATIKYQFVNAFGCTSEVTNVVTVNGIQPVSIVASGSTSFCQGGSVTLTAPAGLNYNWTNGQTTQSITVNTSGTFALAASNAAGCFTTSSTVVVTMNPAPVVNITSTSTTLCQGSNLVLNAPANAASYAWSNGATTQTILINTPGTYSLTLTDANGCSASTNTTIVNGINPQATVSAGGATTFCQGGTVVLNAAGGTSFLWNNGATTQNISVTTPGNYSVMVTNAAGCSSMSNSTIVNVLQAPVAVATAYGSTTFCQGGSVTIATSGGTSYAWSNGSTSQSIIPTTSGSYSVITTGANGCTATSNAINVTVNPTPTAVITPSGATTFCEGSSVNLVASGGATYAWNNGSTAATLAATTGGVYTVTVTNAGGCTDTETLTVTVNEVPSDFIVTSGATTFCQGGEVSLTAQAGNSYVWSNNATTQSIAVTTAGTYSVTILSPNGCSVTTNAITVDVNQPSASNLNATAYDGYTLNGILYTQSGTYTQTLTNAAGCDSTITLDLTLTVGIEEGTLTDVSLYPNPTSESFMIQTSIALYCTYSVVDAQGKLVFEGEMTGTETQVNISSVARGIYYLRISELSEPLRVVKN